MIKIVPNYVRDAIYKKIDAALLKWPDAEPDRALFYKQLLQVYDEHGMIPDFTIEHNPLPSETPKDCEGEDEYK